MTKKKPKPNPIEEAIGDRAKDPKAHEKFKEEYETEPIPQSPSKTPDEPSPQEMLNLEELNRQTEERLLNDDLDQPEIATIPQESVTVPQEATIPVSKPDPLPVTEPSSLESPPQKVEEIDEYTDAEKGLQFKLKDEISIRGVSLKTPAEDVELTALKKYIREDGFVLATVAFHIVTLCAQPMVTPSTTTWDYRDRASVPDMVLALLNQPGYLEGIWPSLAIVMSSNKGNAAWCAGIATTIAFFDVVRTLPALKELKNEEKS